MKTIRIETGGKPQPRYWRFYLGDIDISSYVNAVNIDIDMNSLPGIHVTLVGHLELPDDIVGVITVSSLERE